jgi:hypothetical protein
MRTQRPLPITYAAFINFLPHGEHTTIGAFDALVRLYVLADKLCDLMTSNMVIDRMVRYSDDVNRIPSSSAITLAYDSTASGSPLRALMCDYFIHEGHARYFEIDKATNYPRDFFQDIAARYLERKFTNESNTATVKDAFRVNVSSRGRCHYHQHDSNWTEMECTSKCPQSQPTPVKVARTT